MRQKRAIITLYENDHTDFKTYCASIASNIQEEGIKALKEYAASRNIDMKFETPSQATGKKKSS
jgi:hypothetical protein